MTTAVHEQWRPTLLLTRSFIADYVRNPVNLIVLVLVPLVFVMVAARSLADTMELLGGDLGPALETTTAGWAAGFLSSLVGVIIGPLFGRVAGVFIAFLIPFLDLGIAQSPMLRPVPEEWANLLPGYGWTKVLTDTGLTADFDQTGPLLAGLAWLGGAFIVATLVLARGRTST